MTYKLISYKIDCKLLFKNIRLIHDSGTVSHGIIFNTQGRASETIYIRWNDGLFQNKIHLLEIDYRNPFKPMIIEDIGTIQILE